MTRQKETKPRKIVDSPYSQQKVAIIARELCEKAGLIFPEDWAIYLVNQRRGVCCYRRNYVTIPLWSITKNETYKGFLCRYIAHELAHMFCWINGNSDNHGPNFYAMFKRICPAEYQHYELGYKPRNAKASGITKPIS